MGLLSFASVRQTIVSSAVIASVVLGTTCGAQAATRKRPQVGGYSPPTAAIVVDAKTGKVLYAENPDAPRHPASVTKVMTLYLLFEQLDRGKMTLSTELKVSAHAQRQAPSKLGVSAGETITVEDAIKALVTRSANDVAAVIAENIGGSEDNFAQLMTRKARAIGMSHTVYKNASGLPDPGQITTARDLATLGRAVQSRFPKYYPYFATRSFNYEGEVIGNHNHLLGRIEGVDGIKTGFTRTSGFNLLTSAKLDGHHIVGVVMGGRTGPSRDNTMARLVQTYLPKSSVTGSMPVMADADTDAKPLTTGSVNPRITPPADIAGAKPAPNTVAKQAAKPKTPPPTWMVMIGDAKNSKELSALIGRAKKQSKGALAHAQSGTVTVKSKAKTTYLARFNGLSEQDAVNACKNLKGSGLSCSATRI